MNLVWTETNSLSYILEGAGKNAEEAFANVDGHWVDQFALNCVRTVERC